MAFLELILGGVGSGSVLLGVEMRQFDIESQVSLASLEFSWQRESEEQMQASPRLPACCNLTCGTLAPNLAVMFADLHNIVAVPSGRPSVLFCCLRLHINRS